ncbi:MAG: recombinase zinc beta ribbon domain-containing protein [Rubrobacter sp.]|nr:recombinase zinc beta ribbon domain-containing protein [Rubrobacter sp.]
MVAARQRKDSGSAFYHYYRCSTRRIHGRDACSMLRGLRAEQTEAIAWSLSHAA